MKKALFIQREGALLAKVKGKEQILFLPNVFTFLGKIARELDFELVLIVNANEKKSEFVTKLFEGEGIRFKTFVAGKAAGSNYDLKNSFVIGNDAEIATQLKCQFIELGEGKSKKQANDWQAAYQFLKGGSRKVKHLRKTKETQIDIELDLDGTGKAKISTGLHFFDHMLEQSARHGGIDLKIIAKGDLHIDEHHTIEDTGIALGEAFLKALGDKRGIERYGFCLPMDDALAQVAVDFGGRNWIEWKVKFIREKIGDVPTEMFFHFFKSFTDAARCNLNVKAEGQNEHHKIEAIFKAFAKAIKMSVKRDFNNMQLPSTKGIL